MSSRPETFWSLVLGLAIVLMLMCAHNKGARRRRLARPAPGGRTLMEFTLILEGGRALLCVLAIVWFVQALLNAPI